MQEWALPPTEKASEIRRNGTGSGRNLAGAPRAHGVHSAACGSAEDSRRLPESGGDARSARPRTRAFRPGASPRKPAGCMASPRRGEHRGRLLDGEPALVEERSLRNRRRVLRREGERGSAEERSPLLLTEELPEWDRNRQHRARALPELGAARESGGGSGGSGGSPRRHPVRELTQAAAPRDGCLPAGAEPPESSRSQLDKRSFDLGRAARAGV
jgi:hypothetical protein